MTAPLELFVIVERLDLILPADRRDVSRLLWDRFANKPEEQQFNELTTVNWRAKFDAHQAMMLGKAARAKLDSASLARCCGLVRDTATDGLALIPVGAYQVRSMTGDAWIIVVKWEYESIGQDGMGHFRAWAFDSESMATLGYATCG